MESYSTQGFLGKVEIPLEVSSIGFLLRPGVVSPFEWPGQGLWDPPMEVSLISAFGCKSQKG